MPRLRDIPKANPRDYRIVRWTYSRAHGGGQNWQRVHKDRVDAYVERLRRLGYTDIRIERV